MVTSVMERQSLGIERLNVADIKVDRAYQRALSDLKLNQIMWQWDEPAAGILLVCLRDDGYYVIDGQHRLEAAKRLGIKFLRCQVLIDIEVKKEAELFYKCNTARGAPSSLSVFRARLIAHDKIAMRINQIIEGEGFLVDYTGHQTHGNTLRAIGAVERVFRGCVGPGQTSKKFAGNDDLLKATLRTIALVWMNDRAAKEGQIIGGLGKFYKNYLNVVTPEEVADKLRKVSASQIIAEATAAIKFGGNANVAISLAILRAVNHKRRKNRLPTTIALSDK